MSEDMIDRRDLERDRERDFSSPPEGESDLLMETASGIYDTDEDRGRGRFRTAVTAWWASWGDRVVLWLLAGLASFGIAGGLAVWRWTVEYDTLTVLCWTASSECLHSAKNGATQVALAAFSVLFVIGLVISAALVFRVELFEGRTQVGEPPTRHAREDKRRA